MTPIPFDCRYDFNGALKAINMTAHPKIDPETGDMFSYSVDFFQAPYLTLFKVSADGRKQANVNITLPEACLIHDFAITSNYIVFPDTQIVLRMQVIMALPNKLDFFWSWNASVHLSCKNMTFQMIQDFFFSIDHVKDNYDLYISSTILGKMHLLCFYVRPR